MRILVVGSGGREHALCWKLAQEAEVMCTPGNAGIAADFETYDVAASDLAGIGALCDRIRPDLVVVGPEDPLVAGLADFLISRGHAVFGPRENAAQLEASKAFSKSMMLKAGVPTAAFKTFTDAEAAVEYAYSRFDAGRQVAVKASGNALGKGVVVCLSADEAEDAIGAMLVEREFGDAGATIVIEDRLIGREFSLLSMVSGREFVSLPVSQDHKRALDGDRGPNTGGMGTYSPCDWISSSVLEQSENLIVRNLTSYLTDVGVDYRGILFSGIMVTEDGPMCLEYNVRFGDPETQSVVRRLGTGFADLLLNAATGKSLEIPEILDNHACTVVLASGGYPGKYKKNIPVNIGTIDGDVQLFHAGTAMKDGLLVTSGGRVMGVSAVGNSRENARKIAYEACRQIDFDGMQFRTDIGSN